MACNAPSLTPQQEAVLDKPLIWSGPRQSVSPAPTVQVSHAAEMSSSIAMVRNHAGSDNQIDDDDDDDSDSESYNYNDDHDDDDDGGYSGDRLDNRKGDMHIPNTVYQAQTRFATSTVASPLTPSVHDGVPNQRAPLDASDSTGENEVLFDDPHPLSSEDARELLIDIVSFAIKWKHRAITHPGFTALYTVASAMVENDVDAIERMDNAAWKIILSKLSQGESEPRDGNWKEGPW